MPSRKRKKLDFDASLGNNTDMYSPTDTLKPPSPLNAPKAYSVVLCCNRSVNLAGEYFTNYVKNAASNVTNGNIITTMMLDNTVTTIEGLPFIEEGTLEVRTNNTFERIRSILSCYLPDSFAKGDEEGIKKCRYPDKASGMLNKQRGDLLRIFYRISDDDANLEIILIDPNHLFATETFISSYHEFRKNRTDIKTLLSNRRTYFRKS